MINTFKSVKLRRKIRISFGIIFASATVLATFIAIYPPLGESISHLVDREINELRIIEANLHPRTKSFFDPQIKDFIEVVEVRFTLKNFSNDEILITSMEGELIGSSLLKFATGTIGGLVNEPEKSSAFLLAPGEEKEIVLSDGIKLKGITPFFESYEFQSEFFSQTDSFAMVHNLRWIARLNDQFSSLYGKDASVTIKLFSGYKDLVKSHHLKFSEGQDLFDKSGKLQHDKFLGAIRYLQDKDKCERKMQGCNGIISDSTFIR